MDVILILLCAVLLTRPSDASNICTPARCSPESPFQIQAQYPCGAPGFSLFCRDKKTMIRFPGHRDLVVRSISYGERRLDLVDPGNCVPQVLLNLNLSLTPFRYLYVTKQYTYINCSDMLGNPFVQVPCLSGPRHHVYVVKPSPSIPLSCSVVKTVAIPFSYSPYLSDSGFGLSFTWDPIRISGREADQPGILTQTRKYFRVPSGIVVMGMVMLFSAIISFKKAKGRSHQVEEVGNNLLLESPKS